MFLSPLIDSHCHLTSDRFTEDRDAIVAKMHADGLTHAVLIGTGIPDGQAALALARTAPDKLSVAVGLDPFTAHQLGDINEGFAEAMHQLATLLTNEPICAVGEIGLDYHYDIDPAPVQRAKLCAQLELAAQFNKPVVIHVREAHPDMIAVLTDYPQVRGVIHSFTAGPSEAEAYLKLGWMLAFNGVATFKNAAEVREAAHIVPNDRLLVETDSPYLAPVPLRGKRCQPAFIAHTVEVIAAERGQRPEDVALWTARNACQLFNLDPQLSVPLEHASED